MTLALSGNYVGKQRENGRKIQVSYDSMRSSLFSYQKSVKVARAKYFAHIISRNSHSLKLLFDTINTVLNPVATACPVQATFTCDEFQNFFTGTTFNNI